MYGWRLKIGLVVPSSNTTIEPEFHAMAPDGVSVHATRVYQAETDRPDEKIATIVAMNHELEPAAQRIASLQPGIIAFGCTAPSFLQGPSYDRELCTRLRAATGVPAVTASTAVVLALRALKVERIAMGTPYIDAVNTREQRYFEEALGVEVVSLKGLQIVGNLPKGQLNPWAAYTLAREIDRAAAEAVFLSCTNWPTMRVIDVLEHDLDKPVVTSNQATLWAALRLGGLRDALPHRGRLFGIDRLEPEQEAPLMVGGTSLQTVGGTSLQTGARP